MIKHAITVVMKAVQHLNPGQAAFDQPLYALAKEIQWMNPDMIGEEKLVVMLGGLHIELAALKAVRSLLLENGWTDALVKAGIITTGRAESSVTWAHITRTSRAQDAHIKSLHPHYIYSNTGLTRSVQNLLKVLLQSLNGAIIKPARSRSSNSGI